MGIEEIIRNIKKQTGKSQYYYLNGGCYKFAKMLQDSIGGEIIYLVNEAHCVLKLNGKLYDVTGNVTVKYVGSRSISEEELLKRTKLVSRLSLI